ncbi:PH-protein kinase domain containing protein, partial [Striga asiatica]
NKRISLRSKMVTIAADTMEGFGEIRGRRNVIFPTVQEKSQRIPVCPVSIKGEISPFFHNLKLDKLKAKRVPPSMTPNLIAGMLPVIINQIKPPTERRIPDETQYF